MLVPDIDQLYLYCMDFSLPSKELLRRTVISGPMPPRSYHEFMDRLFQVGLIRPEHKGLNLWCE
jgi:hypothetical protein